MVVEVDEVRDMGGAATFSSDHIQRTTYTESTDHLIDRALLVNYHHLPSPPSAQEWDSLEAVGSMWLHLLPVRM